MTEFKDTKEKIRHIFCSLALFGVLSSCIAFADAANSYEQAMAFRSFGLFLALSLTAPVFKLKKSTMISLAVWIPSCFIITHFGYSLKIIPDTCNYTSVNVLRLSKFMIFIWGAFVISYITGRKRGDGFIKLSSSKAGRITGIFWILFIFLTTLFNRGFLYNAMFVLGYSAMFIVFSEKKNRRLFIKSFFNAFIMSFISVSIFSLLFRPYDTERYGLCFYNTNSAGEYLAAVFAVLVTCLDICYKKGEKKKVIFLNILLAWEGVLAFLNNTRTGILAVILASAVLFFVKLKGNKNKKKVIRRFAVPLILSAVILYPGFLIVRYLPAAVDRPFFFSYEEDAEHRVVKGDPADSPKYTSFKGLLREMFGKWGLLIDFGEEEYVRADGSEQTGKIELDDKDVSNGRMEIWSLFLSRTGLKPHYPGHIEKEDGTIIYHAHNTYFQVSYQFGILSGLVLIFLNLSAVVISFTEYVKGKGRSRGIAFPLLMSIIASFAMLTEWMGHPCYAICFALFTGTAYIMYETGDKR